MLPIQLTATQFARYPPQAKALALEYLPLLRQVPLVFLPSVLRELVEYDYSFPAERTELERQLSYLNKLSPEQLAGCLSNFARLRLAPLQETFDWVNQPGQFTEQLSAYLWSTNQMDAFHTAATLYGDRMRSIAIPDPLPMRRLGVAVIGQGVSAHKEQLFQRLQMHGTYFSKVIPENGLAELVAASSSRAQAHPVPYAHWYIDGGDLVSHELSLTCISYAALSPVRDALLGRIQDQVSKPGMGPEQLRSYLTRLSPAELGMHGDAVLDRFQVKLLTEGSGTQIFSTTFSQWATREALRRAAATTVLVRFAPRQRQRPMSELLSTGGNTLELDPSGSLIDADMAAYYHWINQQRLPGADQSSFLVWFEGHTQALAISPSLPRGTRSESSLTLKELVTLITT